LTAPPENALNVSVLERPASSIATSCRLISFLSNSLLPFQRQPNSRTVAGIFALLEATKQNAASTRGRSGRGMCLKGSMHEQGDQDDDRDGHAEEEQQ
jgi:hypothetical protein